MNAKRTDLNHLSCLRVTGEDRVSFLQGQVSSDVAALARGRATFTSLNNRQGRAFATAMAAALDDEIVFVMPAGQVEDCLTRLRLYVLRAKVSMSAGGLPLVGQWGAGDGGLPDTPFTVGTTADGCPSIRLPGSASRWLVLGARAEAADDGRWHFEDVLGALPQVYPATREQFLPQSLNLDALEGISFEKGCYVGQEVIARLHFRGTVKRRMRAFGLAAGAELPRPGAEILTDGKAAGRVVDAASHDGRSAVLAVCPVAESAEGLRTAEGAPLTPRPLPYPLPSS